MISKNTFWKILWESTKFITASLRKIELNVHQQINFLKLSINIARKMIKNCEFTLVATDFSKACSSKEMIWRYVPALNDMSALQESFDLVKC